MKLIVPAYFYPDPLGSDWDTLLASPAGIGAIIVNDRSGVLAGQTVDANYTTAIGNAHTAGVALLYYVHTSYAARSIVDVKADMDAWISLYGPPTGWFFDEASEHVADVAYYQELYAYAAGRWVWLNFGTTPEAGITGAYSPNPAVDAWVIAETTATGLAGWTWPSEADLSNLYSIQAVIVHDAADGTAFGTAWSTITSHTGIGWAFVGTSSTYAALPSYWSTELSDVSGGILTGFSAPQWSWEPGELLTGGALTPGTFTLSGGGFLYMGYISVSATLSGGGFLTGEGTALTGGGIGSDGLVLTVLNGPLALSPGSLNVKVANGTPGATATITVAGSTAPTTSVVLDAAGGATGISVPISVTSSGPYTMTADDGTLTADASITVSSVDTSGGFPLPTYTPPTDIQNSTGVKKWVFQDPASTDYYHFIYNPDAMTSPFGPKNISYQATTAIDGQKLIFEGQQAPVQWQFSGFVRASGEYDAFVSWAAKRNRIWITDHYHRAWLCYLTQFAPVPRRSVGVPWSHTYTMSALIVYGPVTPAGP